MSQFNLSRRSLLGLSAAAATATLASCARGSGGGGDSSTALSQPKYEVPDKYSGRKTEIVVWHAFGGNNGDAMAILGEKFNDSQDEIYAAFQYQGNYDQAATKLTAALQTGSGPDLTLVNQVYQGKLMLNELVDPMDDFIDFSIYLEQLAEEWTVGESHYQVPFARSVPMMYYNRDVLSDAGLPDRAPETWDELRAWSEDISQLKDPAGNPMPTFMHGGGSADWYMQAYTWEFGGLLSDGLEAVCATGGALDAGAWFQELAKDGIALKGRERENMTSGFVPISVFSSATLTSIFSESQFEVGVGYLPKQTDSAVPTGGSGWSMLKGVPDERREAAAQLIQFFAEPENSAFWALATGYVPVVAAATDTTDYQDAIAENPFIKTAYDQMQEYGRVTDPIRGYIASSASLLHPAVDDLWVNFEDPGTVMQNLENDLQAEADKVQAAYDALFG